MVVITTSCIYGQILSFAGQKNDFNSKYFLIHNIRAYVLLNLLNLLPKSDKILSILFLFLNSCNKLNNTEALE